MNEQFEPAENKMRRISRRSFIWAGVAVLGGYGSIRWIASRSQDNGVPWPLRRALDFTDSFTGELVRKNAPTTKLQITMPARVNGDDGKPDDVPSDFAVTLTGAGDDKRISLAELKKLPRMEMTAEFHCIEGWTQVVHWAGVPFAKFMAAYPPVDGDGNPIDPSGPLENLPAYVSMATADGGYYVGLDMASALHPQTMLCYEMNGEPLTLDHGAPLRLVIPVKYGVKNIKWLDAIAYTNSKPADFWAEQGYDWFAGL